MLAPNLPVSVADHSSPFISFDAFHEQIQNSFGRILRLARHLFDVPIATVNFLDDYHTHFECLNGLEVAHIPYEDSFCSHTLRQKEIFTIPETFLDKRFRNNPYVKSSPHLRFYAGYPLHLNCQKSGTICIADNKPRYFPEDQLVLLKDIAALVEMEVRHYAITQDRGTLTSALEKARMASMVDPLTGLWNRQGIYNILKYRLDDYLLNGTGFAVAILDIDGFKIINDTYGHKVGDKTLTTIAGCLGEKCRDTDAVGRWGGEEFLLLINEPDMENVTEIAERVRRAIASLTISLSPMTSFNPTVTIGLTNIALKARPTVEELINKADQALYQGKRTGRNQVICL